MEVRLISVLARLPALVIRVLRVAPGLSRALVCASWYTTGTPLAHCFR